MPSRSAGEGRAAAWIEDILDNIGLIEDFLAGITHAAYLSDKEKQYAVQFALLAISEAARRLPAGMKQCHPGIPWRQVEDLRNAYTHAYHRLNPEMVWRTARESLGPLKKAMRAELKRST
ncbi:MAG: DUF86 domain-containing protein [Proteobacteria bacterium]|nr:DUF86 domain-containing protein [Pseudomonadota bacterium]MBI3497321.1 DUF86 domain-containing protein [Pseudomonadota bacterium]